MGLLKIFDAKQMNANLWNNLSIIIGYSSAFMVKIIYKALPAKIPTLGFIFLYIYIKH